jgi:hypothetical protein
MPAPRPAAVQCADGQVRKSAPDQRHKWAMTVEPELDAMSETGKNPLVSTHVFAFDFKRLIAMKPIEYDL